MELKEFDILLDIKKNKQIEYIEIVQGDHGSNILNISVADGIDIYELSGLNVEIAFAKADGTTVLQDIDNGIELIGNRIRCTLKTNTIASPGNVLAEVRILEESKLLTTARFKFHVRKPIVNDDTVTSTNEFPILEGLVNDITGIIVTEEDRVTAEQGRVNAEDEREITFQSFEPRITDIELKTDQVENDLVEHKLEYVEFKELAAKHIKDNTIKDMVVESWDDVQTIVRMGVADKVFTIGDQFTTNYNGTPYTLDVIGIDHDKPSDPKYKHSMTLQFHDCIMNCQFSAPQPDNPNEHRKLYGSNNYKESAIRQWLNSKEDLFKWVSQTDYDVASTGAPYNGGGFLKLLDPELVNVLGAVDKQAARNTVTDGGGQDLFSDKVFLPSRVEVYGGTEGDSSGELAYPYYSLMATTPTVAEVDWRIKYLTGSPLFWWLRSPFVGTSSSPRLVHPTGRVYNSTAINAYGVSPACVII